MSLAVKYQQTLLYISAFRTLPSFGRMITLLQVAGMVSLHMLSQPVFGPPFMHFQEPAAAYFIGDTSPQSHPVRYLTAVQSLYDWFQHQKQQHPCLPLVVNTHGWIKVS